MARKAPPFFFLICQGAAYILVIRGVTGLSRCYVLTLRPSRCYGLTLHSSQFMFSCYVLIGVTFSRYVLLGVTFSFYGFLGVMFSFYGPLGVMFSCSVLLGVMFPCVQSASMAPAWRRKHLFLTHIPSAYVSRKLKPNFFLNINQPGLFA